MTCDAQTAPVAHAVLNGVRNEYVVQVTGTVRPRPAGLANPNLPTGEIEVAAESAQILNPARTPPFYINEDADVDEALRLKYRYLDLRRPAMQQNIVLRHRVVKLIRDYMDAPGLHRDRDAHAHQDHARKARAITWCPAACIRGSSTPCPSRRSSSSNC